MNKIIRVAAAIIERNGQFLLSKRLDHLHQGGKWEFPGGKIEADETVEQALIRELREELNITATEQRQFEQLTFDYPEKTVELHFQWVSEFTGEARGVEGQEVKWFSKTELLQLPFPDANVPVLEKLKSIE